MEPSQENTCNFEGCPIKKRFLNLKNNPAIGFFTAIQNEQVELVRHCIERHSDICQPSITDEFNWSALKTAEQTKNEEILNLLTSAHKNSETIIISDSEESNPENLENSKHAKDTLPKKLPFCAACNKTVESLQLHILTISHRLNSNKNSPPKPDFWITPNSIGYKLLKKDGWNEKQGLRENSRLYPVESVIKNSRLAGFGSKNDLEKRVTHFRRGACERIKTVRIEREMKIGKYGGFRRRSSTGSSGLVGLNSRQIRLMMQDF